MNLSPEQQELLSAYLDGEVNAAESALAKALLDRPEARAYFEKLRSIAASVREHGAARAPADFRQRVLAHLEGDFDSISRPTSNQRPVQQLPQAGWRMPLMAAAAAVVVALGVLFTGALTNINDNAKPPSVSRENPNGKDSRINEGQGSPILKHDKAGKDDSKVEPVSPAKAPPPAKPMEQPDKPSDDINKGPGTGGDGKTPHHEPETRDAQDEVECISFDDAATEVSVWADRKTSVTRVYTEMLSTSSLYGSATLRASRVNYAVASAGTDFTDYQGIEVELEEARVPELLAALQRLAIEHGMGNVVVPGYLRRSVAGQLRHVDALQDVADALARGENPGAKELARTKGTAESADVPAYENYARKSRAEDPNARRADGILPPEAQRDMVGRLEKSALGGANNAGGGSGPEQDGASTRPARIVRLIIRVQ